MKYQNIISTLDKAANKMRGKGVKSSDYYNVLLSLIFIKFITSKAQEDFKNSDFKDYNKYLKEAEYNSEWTLIDKPYLWDSIKNSNKNEIKYNIDKAYLSLGKYEENFKDISIYNFTSSDITSEAVLKIIEVIENSFSFNEMQYIDLFGEIYEYFVGKYSANAKRGGEFYTPHSVVKLMTHSVEGNINNDIKNIKVYDPTCGSGGMLIQSLSFLKEKGISEKNMQFFGQELLGEIWRIAKMNFSLRNSLFDLGKKNANIFIDNLFKNQTFDFILSNPPFNVDFLEEDYGHITNDKQWFKYGHIYGSGKANYMFFQHVIAHLNSRGIGAVVMHSAAGTNNKEMFIRKNMLNDNIVEAIFLLPGGIFTNTNIQSTIWIFNKNKINDNVLFIDLQKNTEKIKTQQVIPENTINEVSKIMDSFRNDKIFNTFIPHAIKTNQEIIDILGIPLCPSRFIVNKEKIEVINKDEVILELRSSLNEIKKIENDIAKVIDLLKK